MEPKVKIVPLYEHPHLIKSTAELLNLEWPRSITSRLRSLEQFNSSSSRHLTHLPVSLIMVNEENEENVLGHSRLTRVPSDNHACFVESVVIHPTLRGQGYGRLLMNQTESYAKRIGIETVHLTTHDKQVFYSKLGYEISDPIVIYGLASTSLLDKINNLKIGGSDMELDESIRIENDDAKICNSHIAIEIKYETKESKSPTPPPPPMNHTLTNFTMKTFMKKVLPLSQNTF